MTSDLIRNALDRAFIDKKIPINPLTPEFIVNNPEKKEMLLTVLQKELLACDSFFIAVAFITQSGLNLLKSQLADLNLKGISGKILTSTYLGFNQPDIFKELIKIPNLEVRISEKEGFHSKGYLFNQGNYQTFIVGSSNLTAAALKHNYEWNVKLTSANDGEMLGSIKQHFETEWQKALPLTNEWIKHFATVYQMTPYQNSTEQLIINKNDLLIKPNKMQQVALGRLKALRDTGERKGLIVSATGTGKTFLAAFDVKQVQPKKVLFVCHREQILNKAKDSFHKVLGGNQSDYGILSGNSKNLDATYLFATVQTLSKDKTLGLFNEKEFDYILIDEVHKAGAKTYKRIINYFQPQFLLGMTATPERTDNENIYELFDYNIPYEIRLQEALKEDMLCPFYYFGVTDYEKNGQIITSTTDLQVLESAERVEFLIEKINYYGFSGVVPKGLIFCSRKEEARRLANLFNLRGIPAAFLSGDDKEEQREKTIQDLERGNIHYIFTVDIFNEGIDIPSVNQVVMLRNTKSSIVFIQQLGRGLRKDPSKEFVTIIDFIGNYDNNYMIPMALFGDNSRNKSNLRRDTIDATYLTGLSAVNFESIAKERIFDSIDQVNLSAIAALKNSFYELKKRLNRTPYLLDFQQNNEVDPLLLVQKERTYYSFLKKLKEEEGSLSEAENNALTFISTELLSGSRRSELLIIQFILDRGLKQLSLKDCALLLENFDISLTHSQILGVFHVLDLSFYQNSLKKYIAGQMFETRNNTLYVTETFQQFRKNKYFLQLMLDVVQTGLEKARDYNQDETLTVYKKYRRKDALRLLNMSFHQNEQAIGGYTYGNKQFVIFVTLDKGQDFKGSLVAYEDEFISSNYFKWYTKAPRTLNSPEVKILKQSEEWTIHLFIKRKYSVKDNEIDFYYLGEIKPIKETIVQLEKPSSDGKMKNVVEVDFLLEQTIEPNMYEFLTSSNVK